MRKMSFFKKENILDFMNREVIKYSFKGGYFITYQSGRIQYVEFPSERVTSYWIAGAPITIFLKCKSKKEIKQRIDKWVDNHPFYSQGCDSHMDGCDCGEERGDKIEYTHYYDKERIRNG